VGAATPRIMRFSGAAETVIDCFRYRNLVGMDVAIEALRDCLERNKRSPGELGELAQQYRIWTGMRPYIEALA